MSASARPSGSAGTGGTSGGGAGGTEEGTCTGADTRVSLEFALPAHKDDSKLLLTATNTGDKPCNLYGYPAVRFGRAQSVSPVFTKSRPQSVVVLAPGKAAYAGLLASNSLPDATTEKTLTVAFQGRSVDSNTGRGVSVPLPTSEGVVVDGMVRVTYWLDESEPAVSPLFVH